MRVDGCSGDGRISRRRIESDNGKSERKRNCHDGAVQADSNAPVLDATENKFPKHNFIVLYSWTEYRRNFLCFLNRHELKRFLVLDDFHKKQAGGASPQTHRR